MKTMQKSNFLPKSNGFRFVNRFEINFPTKFKIPFAGEVNLSDVVYGLCGGMCFAALDYFNAGRPVPQEQQVEKIGSKLFIYLCDRQLDSLSLGVLFKVMQWTLFEDRDIGLQMSRYEIPKLRRLLDKGNPAVLALIRVKSLSELTNNHQVLATGYEFDADTGNMSIDLYDPNHPGEEPTLNLSLEKPSQGVRITQSTGEFLRGFFIIDYKRKITPPPEEPVPSVDMGVSFAEPGFSLRWPVDSHRVNQYFGENPDSYKPFGLPGHEGLDLFAPTSANVYACADGTVYQVGKPKDHPYGLHIRVKHDFDGKTYHTIYAHLETTFVTNGQNVSAGDLIGLADNSGNSFGSHLHLTLKVDGEKTPGYPAGIVDPLPFLQTSATTPPPPPSLPEPITEPLPPPSGLTVYTVIQLNIRSQPNTDSKIRGFIPAGEGVMVLGDANQVRPKIGMEGEWLQVQTSSGLAGFVAAWFVKTIDQAFPPSDLVIYPDDVVNLRSGPATTFELLAALQSTDPLTVLGDSNNAAARIGKMGEWIQVQTGNGARGFVAAWLVHKTGQTPPATDLTVHSTDLVNVRARPSTDSNVLTVVKPSDSLIVLGDKAIARSHLGQMDQWLGVRTPEGLHGYVAAWLVQEGQATTPVATPGALTVFPNSDLNIRAQASINSPRIGGAPKNEPLDVTETDLKAAQGKIGKQDMWIHIQTKSGIRGWAAAWFLSAKPVR